MRIVQQALLLSIGILIALFPSKYVARLIVKKCGELKIFNNIIIVTITIFIVPYFIFEIVEPFGIEFFHKYQYLLMAFLSFSIGIPLHLNSIQLRKK